LFFDLKISAQEKLGGSVISAPYPLYAGKADMFSVGIDVRYVSFAPLLAKKVTS
jgi:hypothetical protein